MHRNDATASMASRPSQQPAGGSGTAVMGTKQRAFSALPPGLSLEELVPDGSFYRRPEERPDLSFVREPARPSYAEGGRPSVDPVVLSKMQPVVFFEGIRSERRPMRAVADRLSLRWYLGYDPFERLPDHPSLTRIRERFGVADEEAPMIAAGQDVKRMLEFGNRGPRKVAQAAAFRPGGRRHAWSATVAWSNRAFLNRLVGLF